MYFYINLGCENKVILIVNTSVITTTSIIFALAVIVSKIIPASKISSLAALLITTVFIRPI